MQLGVRCDRPTGVQRDFVCQDFGDGAVARCDFIAGRGAGKTTATVLLALRAAIDNNGCTGLVMAPTHKLLTKTWVASWEKIVPTRFYKINRVDEVINCINGSKIYLASRYIDNPSRGRDAHRGLNLSWVIDDEAALGYSAELYSNVSAAIREPARYRFFATATTPRVDGGYQALIETDGHRVYRATSRDNPHLPTGWADDLALTMSPQQVLREIEGQFVALEGLVWPYWSREQWPAGNVHSHSYDPALPWHLWCDFGVANGAYLVVQCVTRGRPGHDYPQWVVVAELLPRSDGSASRAFALLHERFGAPATVTCGADATTRSNADGRTPYYFARQLWGGVNVDAIADWRSNKRIQHDRASFAVLSSRGERRLCVARDLQELEHRSGRGVRELFAQDTWPAKGHDFLAKEGRLEHVRDAILYGVVARVAQPSMAQQLNRAS